MTTYDSNSLLELADRTQYEVWLLEAVYKIVEDDLFPVWPDTVVYPLDSQTAKFTVYMRGNIIVGDWRGGFLGVGAPLVFVSAFKLLDMIMEWVLHQNGVPQTFRFQQKMAALRTRLVFPPVIEHRAWLKDRLIALYAALEPLRGTIIHDRHFTSQNGELSVSSSRGGVGPAVALDAASLRLLVVTIVSVIKYLDGTWMLSTLRERSLRHQFDGLASLHSLPILGQRRPYHTCARIYQSSPDPFRADLPRVRSEVMAKYNSDECTLDVRIIIVKDGKATDSYFFPWQIVESAKNDWGYGLDKESYRAAMPTDMKPEHLRHDAA